MTNLFTEIASMSVMAVMGVNYAVYRHPSRAYVSGKSVRIPALPGMVHLYRPIQLCALFATVASINLSTPILVQWTLPLWARVAGVLLSIGGTGLLVWSKYALGKSYSPCFDSWVATELVKQGPYRWVRHPMYSGNCVILVGFLMLSGSGWIALLLLVLSIYFACSASFEERTLELELPYYRKYKEATGAFLPRLRF